MKKIYRFLCNLKQSKQNPEAEGIIKAFAYRSDFAAEKTPVLGKPEFLEISGQHQGVFKSTTNDKKEKVIFTKDKKPFISYTNSKVVFNNKVIGVEPHFHFMLGYEGRYQSDHGIYTLQKLNQNTSFLLRGNSQVGVIMIEHFPKKKVILSSDGTIDLPHQLVILSDLYEFIDA